VSSRALPQARLPSGRLKTKTQADLTLWT